MRVLMLGWEFPPTINGGLGTACAGLVGAMDSLGVSVSFVTPEPAPPPAPRVDALPAVPTPSAVGLFARDRRGLRSETPPHDERRVYERVRFHTIPVQLSPYASESRVVREAWITDEFVRSDNGGPAEVELEGEPVETPAPPTEPPAPPAETGLFADVKRFTRQVEALAEGESFDVIHAHDWMTFPAGLAIAARTGKPLVVHVHSTEFDRGHDDRIRDIERRGAHGAVRVIAVSDFTRRTLVEHYGVPADKIDVVYNAVEPPPDFRLAVGDFSIKRGEKLVLFMGRLTSQKGPDYFLTAARKVLAVMHDVKFVMAGDGDLARRTVELASQFGIAHKVLFTGFLRGLDVERIFQLADLFVMPSVSEPFGIAPLEAIVRQVPTIISRQSGVSEVLLHALKVDFWDTDELANKIVAVLRHPTLANMMRADADRDVAKLSWPAAARQCLATYAKAAAAMP